MKYDFHTHSMISDGDLLPVDIIRNFYSRRGKVIAITDHVSVGDLEHVIHALTKECKLAERHWHLQAIPGVEITHVPPRAIRKVAVLSKRFGAELVIVHGQTIAESVDRETNLRAVQCPEVDILAHPGLLTPQIATMAAKNGIFIELNPRPGHCLTNGYVVKVGLEAGVKFLINSDAHRADELLTTDYARKIGRGAGLTKRRVETILHSNPKELLARIGREVV